MEKIKINTLLEILEGINFKNVILFYGCFFVCLGLNKVKQILNLLL